jgi:hypothetical protein
MRLSLAECRFVYEMTFNHTMPYGMPYLKAAEAAIAFTGEERVETLLNEIRDGKVVERWVAGLL